MFLSKVIKKVPVVSDYYRYYWLFPRQFASYRGVYDSFNKALEAVPKGKNGGYSQPEIDRSSSVARLTAASEIGTFNSIDYPVLLWLKSAFVDSSTVFDWGGNVGLAYYAYQKYLQYPDDLNWLVCEIPEIVKYGTEIAAKKGVGNLRFTSKPSQANGYDILLTCGALQYIENTLAELLQSLKVKPKHVLINHVPFSEHKAFITLQNIGYTFCPYKIQNKAEFIYSLDSLKYELIDTWEVKRNCIIPFYADYSVSAYYGFYFRYLDN